MITISEFEEILLHIKQNRKDNDKLTKILVSDDCTGFTSFGDKLVHDLIKLLSLIFGDKYDNISWWLWEETEKFVWYKNRKYDLTQAEDLYYWLKGDLDLVKSDEDLE